MLQHMHNNNNNSSSSSSSQQDVKVHVRRMVALDLLVNISGAARAATDHTGATADTMLQPLRTHKPPQQHHSRRLGAIQQQQHRRVLSVLLWRVLQQGSKALVRKLSCLCHTRCAQLGAVDTSASLWQCRCRRCVVC
jgi:hypothetical protein